MQICQICDNIVKFDTMKIKMRKSKHYKIKKLQMPQKKQETPVSQDLVSVDFDQR